MNGKIDAAGVLFIECGRRGNEKQLCMASTITEYGPLVCGDDCPLFGEPEIETKTIPMSSGPDEIEPTGRTALQICQNRTLYFDTFTDERG